MTKTATVKLTSAIGVRGKLLIAGAIIEIPEDAAKDLLRRGKAELATEADEVAELPDASDDEVDEDQDAAPKSASKKK